MQTSPKILFLALSGIGNYLMQSPTIAALKRKHPDWHVTVWVAPRGTKALAEADPNVDAVVEAPIKNSLFGHIKTILKLRRGKYDTGIVLSPGQLFKSAAYLYLAGIPERIGNSYPLKDNPNSSALLTTAIDEKENTHDIEQNLALLSPLDINLTEKVDYSLNIPASNQKEAEKKLEALGIPTGKKIIGIHAGSAPDLTFKRWPLQNFASIAKELIQKDNAHILLFGGPDEKEQKQELKEQITKLLREDQQLINESAVSIISTSLLATAAIMQKCDYILSNDSGLMHLAAVSESKVFGLFGPTNEKKTGPRGANSHIIRAPKTTPTYDTEKNPDLGNEPDATIKAITTEQVIHQLR